MEDYQENERLQLAFDYVYYTGRNVFLTGKAGTGKTTFLKKLRKTCPKRMIVTSPTGVAAVNAGGVTLHSFFQLPFGPRTPDSPLDHKQGLNNRKISVIKTLELLVIDEISMVRADLLDSVDQVLRRYRHNNKPFGGVQLLLIGDMQQLSPVIRPEDEDILRPYYDSYYFFGSLAWRKTSYVCIELDHVFRQTDGKFITLLNSIREGRVDIATINALNSRCIPNYQQPKGEDIVTLVTTNRQADSINQTHMIGLATEQREFAAEVKGEFPESSFPVDKNLILKKDAVVMFVKNDPSYEHLFYNGKIGRITGFGDDGGVFVRCNGESEDIAVSPLAWENTKYEINPETKEIKESVIGTFTQIPLRIAWAVTIHKSQGLTFDRLMIDAANSFAHGQVYVALSRCRTLEGLVLLRPISAGDIISDPQVRSFAEMVEQNMPDQSVLRADKREYFFDIVTEMFDFHAIYNDLQGMQRFLTMYASSVMGNKEAFNGLDSIVLGQLIVVSDKFMQNIRYNYRETPDVATEPTLLQRIQKGCAYYVDKMQTLIEPTIKTFAFDCDDKQKKEKLLETYKSLAYNYDLKKNILVHLKDDFSIKRYLMAKAEMSLELSKDVAGGSSLSRVQPNASSVTSKYVSNNPELYNDLVQWRKNKADDLNVKSTDVVATKTILEISNKKPTTVKDLMAITGMKGKGKPYIAEIMKVLLPHIGNVAGTMFNADQEMQSARYESLSTYEKTLYHFNNGKSAAEIASERKLTVETVMKHLAGYVAKGEVDPLKLMSKDRIERIRMFMLENPNSPDKKVVDGVKGGCNYGEVSVVRAIMESNLYDN